MTAICGQDNWDIYQLTGQSSCRAGSASADGNADGVVILTIIHCYNTAVYCMVSELCLNDNDTKC